VTQAKPDRSPRRGSETRARRHQVTVRLSDDELAALDRTRGEASRGCMLRRWLTDGPVVTEYAVCAGGARHVREDRPDLEQAWPLAEWIRSMRPAGGVVGRRRIIVVDGWEEVPRG
jgi:hypothetical protein